MMRVSLTWHLVSPALREGFPPQATGVSAASPQEIPEGRTRREVPSVVATAVQEEAGDSCYKGFVT
ncbi:hypothetical protein [Brasilonema bromeliae]|uniref:hypothetical protein n=1 Tax=Brasilonema bromeliae TaxID=383615 RepID=UPI001B7D1CD5|nr:hypothetical protein [Brasilonema bromeliae]